MYNGFNQKIDLTGRIERMSQGMGLGLEAASSRLESPNETSGANFKGVMAGLVKNVNDEVNAPDQLLKRAMVGDEDVDIHDVMTAMAKAELSINLATQVTTKVIQSYEKIMQISV